jgi:ubiquinone/menaquinone biosynthesis C-methylase UbiE
MPKEPRRVFQSFHMQHLLLHAFERRRPMASQVRKTYHEEMKSRLRRERPVRNLESRLVFHYSRIADWLGTRSWYQDDGVTDVVKFLISGRPARVLELCCGTGLLLESLSKAFPKTEFIGVDISPKMVERARERLSNAKNVAVLQQDWIYELPTEWNGAFDVVIVKNALHLLDNLESKLRDLRRVSRDLASLIIVETVSPNADSNEFIKRLFEIVDVEQLKQSFFTERTLAAVLERSGWLMAQSRPWYVRQHIDTDDWLRQKCPDHSTLENAREFLAGVRNLRVRQAMDFFTEPGTVPAQMLRLQYIARHVYVPERPRIETQKDEDMQLLLG